MTTTAWRVAWAAPVRVCVSPDRSSRDRIAVIDGGAPSTGVVQFSIGVEARLTLITEGGPVEVIGGTATGRVYERVLEVVCTPPEAPADEAAAAMESAGSDADTGADTTDDRLPPGELKAALQPDLDQTVLTVPGVAPEDMPPMDMPPMDEPDSDEPDPDEDDPDETVVGAVPGPASGEERDFDETVIGHDGTGNGNGRNGTGAGAEHGAGSANRILLATVTDANGPRTVQVQGADVFIGRAPRVPPEREATDGALVVVASRTAHVSGTHLQLTRQAGRLLARDLWSTNGTMLAPAVGAPYRMEPGEILPLVDGTRLVLADDVTIDVTGADATSPAEGAPRAQ